MILALLRAALVAAALFIWYIATTIYIFAERQDVVSADAAIVLGAAVWNDRPSPIFRERINHAIGLYQAGQVDYLIFTGGLGARDVLSEAEVARRYARARGVPDQRILIEERSTSTYENLLYAQQVARRAGLETFVITSTPYHMRRALAVARDLGMTAYSSPTQTTRWISSSTETYFYVREVVAMAYYLLGG